MGNKRKASFPRTQRQIAKLEIEPGVNVSILVINQVYYMMASFFGIEQTAIHANSQPSFSSVVF